MKKISTVGPLALIVLAAGPIAGAAPAKEPASLCTGSEEVVFTCAQGGKIISLCAPLAAKGQSPARLRYAAGSKGKVELEITQADHPEAFSAGETAVSGGGIDYVRINNGDFAYVVYTGMSRSWSQDGWVVEAHGAPISHHICKTDATGPDVWSPVYAAKPRPAADNQAFQPPSWVGASPPKPKR